MTWPGRNHCQNSQQIARHRPSAAAVQKWVSGSSIRRLSYSEISLRSRILFPNSEETELLDSKQFINFIHGRWKNIACGIGTIERDSENELGERASAFETLKCESRRLVAANLCSLQGLSQQALMEIILRGKPLFLGHETKNDAGELLFILYLFLAFHFVRYFQCQNGNGTIDVTSYTYFIYDGKYWLNYHFHFVCFSLRLWNKCKTLSFLGIISGNNKFFLWKYYLATQIVKSQT